MNASTGDEGAELGAASPHQQRAADLAAFAGDGFACVYLDAADIARWHEGVTAAGADPSAAELRTYSDGVAVVFYVPPKGGAR